MRKFIIVPLIAILFSVTGCGIFTSDSNNKVNSAMKSDSITQDVHVRVLSGKDCINTPPTIKLIQRIAASLDIAIIVENIFIDTQEEAVKYRFLGSPTVQIDGLDLDIDARKITDFGIG